MRLFLMTVVLLNVPCVLAAQTSDTAGAVVQFAQSGPMIGAREQERAREIIREAEGNVRALLPGLSARVEIIVVVVSRDLALGGVSGRAERPGVVLVELSSSFPGGIAAAVEAGLAATIFHEFHHLVRGWTMTENRFGPGIPIAAVNEGLASVFAETYTGVVFDYLSYPDEAAEWLEELMALPVDANYNEWMNEHPDGRMAIGYRIGRYIVHQAMEQSGQSVLELSTLAPAVILALARR